MKNEKLFQAIGLVGDDLIARADEPAKKLPHVWIKWAALAACCVLVIGAAAFVLPMFQAKSSAPTADTTAAEAPASADTWALPETDSEAANETAPQDAAGTDADATESPESPESGTMYLGPLTLGMTEDEIRAAIGEPDETSNSGAVTDADGTAHICWFYKLTSDVHSRYDAALELADKGTGWVLNAVTVMAGDWTTPEGIGIGSAEQDVIDAYPDAALIVEDTMENDVLVERNFYRIGSTQTYLQLRTTDGIVDSIYLGTYFAVTEFEP